MKTECLLSERIRQVFEFLLREIKNHSTHAPPLQRYLEQYTKRQAHHVIVLDAEAKNAFNTIKEVIECCPKLFFLTDTDPIIVYTDASTYDMGGYITQLVAQYNGKRLKNPYSL